jgi:hypothetical protein
MARDPRPIDEFTLQKFVVQLLRLSAYSNVVWFAVPNGEHRSPRTGAKLKAQGVIPGVADLVVVVKGHAHFLELKTERGRTSAEQRAFAEKVADARALYAVARSPEAARNILEIWRAIPGASGSVARRAA